MSAAITSGTPAQLAQSGGQIYLSNEILNYVTLMFLVVGITFVHVIPIEIRRGYNTLLGGLGGLSTVVFLYYYFNWYTSLLAALLLVLIINSGLLHTEKEGFEPGIDTRFVGDKKKWYIEQVLGENPVLIEENNISTSAVQDDASGSGISRSIQSGSNL